MESELSQPILHFAIDIYKQLKGSGDNVFFSPFSIAAALSMTLAGTRGNTANEISTALHVQDSASIHGAFSHLRKSFLSYAPDIALHVANRIYCERALQPLRAFCTLLEEYYSTTIESVDFRNDAETARQDINAWVESVTNDKIKDLLGKGAVNDSTLMVLVNAVYFKGTWEDRFKESLTEPMDFHETCSITKKVDMMFQEGPFRMGYNSDMKASILELPYTGNNASMVVLLPDDIEGLTSLEECLTLQNLSSALDGMTWESKVELYLPKFKIEYETKLREVLENLGIKHLFSDTGDLTGISKNEEVKFSDAVHKTFVDVNEHGTEAAAATATFRLGCSMQQKVVPPKVFKADHPFMFLIRTREPNVVLFAGSLKHP